MAPRILLVDDEPAITENLRPVLERSGFEVETAGHGEEALRKIARRPPDLVVLDILMPGMNGREVLRRLRSQGNRVPVIMLTQVDLRSERVAALNEGADDYINKPFDVLELEARIRAVLRRAPAPPPPTTAKKLACGALVVDRVARRAYLEGKELSLTPKAFALLDHLMVHHGQAFSREELLNLLWGWEYPTGTRAVDMRVSELRGALGDERADPRFIVTIPGQGYQFIGLVEVLA